MFFNSISSIRSGYKICLIYNWNFKFLKPKKYLLHVLSREDKTLTFTSSNSMIFSRMFEFCLYISIKSMLAYSYIMLKYYLCWWCLNILPQAVYYHTVVKPCLEYRVGFLLLSFFLSIVCRNRLGIPDCTRKWLTHP